MHIIVPLDLYLKKIKNKNNSTHFKLKIWKDQKHLHDKF